MVSEKKIAEEEVFTSSIARERLIIVSITFEIPDPNIMPYIF